MLEAHVLLYAAVLVALSPCLLCDSAAHSTTNPSEGDCIALTSINFCKTIYLHICQTYAVAYIKRTLILNLRVFPFCRNKFSETGVNDVY